MNKRDLIAQFSMLFKRVTLDEIDIIARGEEPKHSLFIYLEDLPEIKEKIKTSSEEDAISLIASKIHRKE